MNLENYIQQLLYNFDCVIIPNFGGIVAQPIGASIHGTQNVFYAPKKQLAFNKNLNSSDGLLVNHVALLKNISYQESYDWVNLQVNAWLTELKLNGKLRVAEIGSFLIDKEQNIQFEPATFVNYNVNAFGCASFQAMPVLANNAKFKNKVQPKFVEVPKSKQARKIVFKRLIPYAIAIPILAITFYVPTQTTLLNNKSIALSSLNPFDINTKIISKYSERIPVELPILQTINFAASETIDNNLNSNDVSKTRTNSSELINNLSYHLIVGSFSTKENANELIIDLNKKGFHAYIQGTSASGLIRVSCNGFANKEQATFAKNEAKQQGVEAWLLQE